MKWQVQSPGFKTEMIFHRFDGLIVERENYLVVKTPSNPGFFFGNFLMFLEAPKLGSLEKWKELFRIEFADSPSVQHFTFLWDSPTEGIGNVEDFEKENYKVDYSVVLSAQAVHRPQKHNAEVDIRIISSDEEWAAVTHNQIISKTADYEEETYRIFKYKQMARYRVMSEQGLGHWFGAFLKDRLVADLGIFREGELGRFQSVETHPDFLRQGICGSLVYQSAKYAFEKMKLKNLIMVADENYHAAKIYESVGFTPVAKEYSAFWWGQASLGESW